MRKKIRWGVLSTANIAQTQLIPAIQGSKNGEVAAIASRNPAKARDCADRFGVPLAFGSYEELLAETQVDAVYNPLPVSLHAEWSLRCAEAGKPVMCEKPLARNAEEAVRMAAGFKERNLLLAEAFMCRFHPMTRRVLEILRAGGVGQINLIRASFSAEAEGKDNIRLKKELGGGALWDVGCYCVSMARLAAGEEPDDAAAFALWGKDSGVDESLAGVLRFPSGALAYFGCAFKSHFDCSYDIIGTKGRILVDQGGMVAWPGGEFKIRHWLGSEHDEITIPPANHYRLMAEDFAAALLDGRPPAYPVEDSVNNLRVMDRLLAGAGKQDG